MLFNIGIYCKSLDKQETLNGSKGLEKTLHPIGIPGRLSTASHNSGTHYMAWCFRAQQWLLAATAQAFGDEWPFLISQVYCNNTEQTHFHHGQGNPHELIFIFLRKIVIMCFNDIFASDFDKCFHVLVAL
jgi:hypothetical protein